MRTPTLLCVLLLSFVFATNANFIMVVHMSEYLKDYPMDILLNGEPYSTTGVDGVAMVYIEDGVYNITIRSGNSSIDDSSPDVDHDVTFSFENVNSKDYAYSICVIGSSAPDADAVLLKHGVEEDEKLGLIRPVVQYDIAQNNKTKVFLRFVQFDPALNNADFKFYINGVESTEGSLAYGSVTKYFLLGEFDHDIEEIPIRLEWGTGPNDFYEYSVTNADASYTLYMWYANKYTGSDLPPLVGFVSFTNLLSDHHDVTIMVDDVYPIEDIPVTGATLYLNFFYGEHKVTVYSTSNITNTTTPLEEGLFTLGEIPMSVFITGSNIADVVVKFGLDGMNGTKPLDVEGTDALFRLGHFGHGFGPVDVYFDNALILESIDFGEISDYYVTSPGPHSVKAVSAGAGLNGIAILNQNLLLQPSFVFTMVGVGNTTAQTTARYLNQVADGTRIRLANFGYPGPVDLYIDGELIFSGVDLQGFSGYTPIVCCYRKLQITPSGGDLADDVIVDAQFVTATAPETIVLQYDYRLEEYDYVGVEDGIVYTLDGYYFATDPKFAFVRLCNMAYPTTSNYQMVLTSDSNVNYNTDVALFRRCSDYVKVTPGRGFSAFLQRVDLVGQQFAVNGTLRGAVFEPATAYTVYIHSNNEIDILEDRTGTLKRPYWDDYIEISNNYTEWITPTLAPPITTTGGNGGNNGNSGGNGTLTPLHQVDGGYISLNHHQPNECEQGNATQVTIYQTGQCTYFPFNEVWEKYECINGIPVYFKCTSENICKNDMLKCYVQDALDECDKYADFARSYKCHKTLTTTANLDVKINPLTSILTAAYADANCATKPVSISLYNQDQCYLGGNNNYLYSCNNNNTYDFTTCDYGVAGCNAGGCTTIENSLGCVYDPTAEAYIFRKCGIDLDDLPGLIPTSTTGSENGSTSSAGSTSGSQGTTSSTSAAGSTSTSIRSTTTSTSGPNNDVSTGCTLLPQFVGIFAIIIVLLF